MYVIMNMYNFYIAGHIFKQMNIQSKLKGLQCW